MRRAYVGMLDFSAQWYVWAGFCDVFPLIASNWPNQLGSSFPCTAMNGSVTSSTFSSEESFEYHEHNIWNPMLASLCHFEVGVVMEALLDEVDMGRIALACHFSLDVLCDKTSSLPVVNDHVSVRNWPPLLPHHVETESDDSILRMSREEDLDR